MHQHEKINYLEFPAADIKATQRFFQSVFGWQFTDYGPDYSAFQATDAGLDGGFFRSEKKSDSANGAALTVFYSEDPEKTQQKIERAGGKITVPLYDFPGGRRFHFVDPNGNEFAVWGAR